MKEPPQLSVIIPAYNRVQPLRLTLQTVLAAAQKLPTEVIVVDDGSSPPVGLYFADLEAIHTIVWLRQSNQGSIVARLTGLQSATGQYVLFLDSDDLVHPEKFIQQVNAMREVGSDLSYSDMAQYHLDASGQPVFSAGQTIPTQSDSFEFFLRIQPPPHNPIYRRDYLMRHLTRPLVPPNRKFDAVGDVWIYYNLLLYPCLITKVEQPLTAVGVHEENRYSQHWEKLGLAALHLAEAFFAACPETAETEPARRVAGETAFVSWRCLPIDFHPEYNARLLRLWRRAPRSRLHRLGGATFQRTARVLGPRLAGWILRRLNGKPYSRSRTLTDDEYRILFAGL